MTTALFLVLSMVLIVVDASKVDASSTISSSGGSCRSDVLSSSSIAATADYATAVFSLRGGSGGFPTLLSSSQPVGSNKDGIDMGTTLVALHYRDGIVIGADTRTSSFPYVSNREAYKITPIHNINVWDDDDDNIEKTRSSDTKTDGDSVGGRCHVVIARSGSAADTQQLASIVERVIYQRMLNRRQGMMMISSGSAGIFNPVAFGVSQVAHLLRYIVRSQQQEHGYEFAASLIVAGWENNCDSSVDNINNSNKGWGRIYSLSTGGTLLDESTPTTRFAVSGSGSTVLLGQLDSLVSSSGASPGLGLGSGLHDDRNKEKNSLATMHQKDAIKLCCSLLRQSMARDNASGGIIRLVVLNDAGRHSYTVYPNQQSLQLHDGGGNDRIVTLV